MNKLLVLVGILVCVNAVLVFAKDKNNNYFETGRPIVSLYNKGGYLSDSVLRNQVPEVKLWEDGTIIIATVDEKSKRHMLFSTVAADEISHLKDKVAAGGFLDFNAEYAQADAPTDGQSTCIKFWSTETESKEVCEYVSGAPEFFHVLVTRLQSLKASVQSKAQPFFPV
jgi:hypothetical protein